MIFNKLSAILKRFKESLRVNRLKTLYFNFKMFPYHTAKKLPIYFYGKVRFGSLKGQVIINTPIKRGVVKFGLNIEMTRKSIGISEVIIDGVMKINGNFCTGVDYVIIIVKGGVLEIGENSHLGSRTRLVVTNKVILGRHFRLSYESQISDSSLHYLLDTELNEVRRMEGTVLINDYCWIGNRTTIMKNTITPRYTIVASNSLLNRDYTKDISERSVIGGIPAKLLKTNTIRVFDPQKERIIQNYFNSHADAMTYKPEDLF